MVSIVPKAPGGAVKEWDCRRSQRRTFHPGRTPGTVPAEVFAWIAKPNQINREGRTQRTPEPRADTVNCGYAAFRAHRRGSPGPGRQTSDPRDAFAEGCAFGCPFAAQLGEKPAHSSAGAQGGG